MEFRKIPSLNFEYEISADGQTLRSVATKKPRKFYLNDSGYLCVNVDFGSYKRTRYVADLVAECWLGQKPKGYQIDHINRNRTNNHHKNLRYVTPRTNAQNTNKRQEIFITLNGDTGTHHFRTQSSAAHFIFRQRGKSLKWCLRKFAGRKDKIFGYNVIYSSRSPIQLSLFEEDAQ